MSEKRRIFDLGYQPRERRRANILAGLLFSCILSFYLTSHFVVGATEVVGASMVPTLGEGDRFLINRMVYRLRAPRRGEIVALRFRGDKDFSVKRIVALPGDHVSLRGNAVHVNGIRLHEPYLPTGTRTPPGRLTGEYEVAEGCYFVLGDNRGNSWDSRCEGAIPRAAIVGHILFPAF